MTHLLFVARDGAAFFCYGILVENSPYGVAKCKVTTSIEDGVVRDAGIFIAQIKR